MLSLESLLRTLGRWRRENLTVLEHDEVREKVSPTDLVRLDQYNRKVVACPAWTSPPSWLVLTEEERDGLVDAPPPKPTGHLNPGQSEKIPPEFPPNNPS